MPIIFYVFSSGIHFVTDFIVIYVTVGLVLG